MQLRALLQVSQYFHRKSILKIQNRFFREAQIFAIYYKQQSVKCRQKLVCNLQNGL